MRTLLVAGLALALGAGLALNAREGKRGEEKKKVETRFFELRTYHAVSGKMKALNARFREHTNKLIFYNNR